MRRPDWEDRLNAYLADHADAVFKYGTCDCALFAAGAVIAMTDADPAAAFRGRYRSHAGSVRALRRFGAGTLEATMDAVLTPLAAPAFALRGDVVMAEGSLGICIGGTALFVGEEDGAPGLVRIGRAEWTRAWAVGER
jgi:hypothetical protein